MNRPLPVVLAAVLAVAACSQEPARSPEPANTDENSVPVAAPARLPAPSAADEPTELASRYTRFDLSACEVLREDREEGTYAEYRCAGLPGVPLLVQEGDGRFDLDAGIDDGGFQTIGAFNDIGPNIEWRMRGGAPFAVIFRFLDVSTMNPGRTVLAVEKVGRPGSPGCRVANIAGDIPEANARARALADRETATFRCGRDEPTIIGEAR